jgi:hypothetical protein
LISNAAASDVECRDVLLEVFPVSAFVPFREIPVVLNETVHLSYVYSLSPFSSREAFRPFASSLVHLLPNCDGNELLFVLVNCVEHPDFDELMNVPAVTDFLKDLLFSELNPAELRPLLWILSFIFERNALTSMEIL